MAEAGLDALLMYSYKNNAMRYLTGYSPSYSVTNSALLILPIANEPMILTRLPGHLPEAQRTSFVSDVRVSVSQASDVGSLDQMASDAKDALEASGRHNRVGLIGYSPELGMKEPLEHSLQGSTLVNANHIVDELRMVKSPAELRIIRRAAEIADDSYRTALEVMAEGGTEHDVFAAAESTMKKLGALGSYCLFGVCKNDISYMRPTFDPIRKGRLYFLETIPEYEGYWPEKLSSVAVGRVTGGVSKLFRHAEVLYEQVTGAIKPGISIAELMRVTRKMVSDIGLGNLQIRLGHGIGLDNIERPEFFSDTDETIIEPGMVFAIHPIVNIAGVASAHVGAVVIVKKSGVESTSKIEPRIPII